MHLILLSGGSGKRLWPLSNDIRSKQFIKFFRREDGKYESMVQRIYRQIQSVDPQTTVTIATSKAQVSVIHNQLGNQINLCVEPSRRDTFPAIALACAYLRDVKKVSEDRAVVVCPVDPFVDEDYFLAVKKMARLVTEGAANLSLMGIEPTYPSEKYGYIMPESQEMISAVSAFKEKPDAATAQGYIQKGALWNGGVFAFKLGYMINKSHELIDYSDYTDLVARYHQVKKISFDYAVAEREPSTQVMRFSGRWVDLGTWNTLTEAMEENSIGNVRMDDSCDNVHVINEMNVPILCMGLKNAIVSASPEGILVSDKEQSSYIKPYVDALHQQLMFAEKSWGSFQVLDVGESSLTIKAVLKPGQRMHYHSHTYRDEVWTVVSGEGLAVVDEAEIVVRPGTIIRLPVGCRHTIMAYTAMTLIEVQLGHEISTEDKTKHILNKDYACNS